MKSKVVSFAVVRKLSLLSTFGLFLNWSFVLNGFAQSIPVTVGSPRHIWSTLLGGVVWLPTREAAKMQAATFSEYGSDVLVDLKAPSHGFGYRFDLNYWEPSAPEYGWFAWDGTDAHEPTNLDQMFQIYGRPNAKFVIHIPLPRPGGLALSFPWQSPEFYAAECQYLFGQADSVTVYSALPTRLDFYSQPGSFNWANLRARRGRVQPYQAEAIILGEEPYHIEDWASDQGADFGALAEKCRQLLRGRGVGLPYGVHVNQLPPSDPARQWFYPMLSALSSNDPPGYLDLYHYYSFETGDDWLRSFPVARKAEGFVNWWIPQSEWRVDYTRFLWLVPDTRLALAQAGLDYQNYKLGFSEHGITISSAFKFNDMMGAIHWANWLAELMRMNTHWDSMWTLGAQGFSTAQIQYFDSKTTRTPAFFVYKMAAQLKGLRYLDSTVNSPWGSTTNTEGQTVYFPVVSARLFVNEATQERHIFAINQHPTQSYTLTGLEGWPIASWERIKGDTYSSGNDLTYGSPSPIQIEAMNKAPDAPLTLDTISINHIVIKPSGAPVAVAGASLLSGFAPLSIQFSSAGSLDSDGSIVAYAWTFGDGSTSTATNPSHTFVAAGNYLVSLTVTDNEGKTGSASVSIAVQAPNTPPVAAITTLNSSGTAPLTVQFSGAGSTDPDGQIVSYQWNFGDGATASGANVQHIYSSPGTYAAVLTVTDNLGAIGQNQTAINVVLANQAPVAAISASPTSGRAPLTVQFSGSGSKDADGQIVSYQWNFGDGTTASGATVQHTYSGSSTYTAVLVVTDDVGATGKAQTVISVARGIRSRR